MLWSAFTTGFALCATLIVAIGAQNAFVLRQGLKGEHVTPIVIFCALSDLLLIGAGVAGLASALGNSPALTALLTITGAIFLCWYGVRALRRALEPQALRAASGAGPTSLRTAVAQAAGFTLLNPHVYLDTVLLMGSIGARQPPDLRKTTRLPSQRIAERSGMGSAESLRHHFRRHVGTTPEQYRERFRRRSA